MSYIVDLLGTALLGRYEVERELGRGGMATVLLAEDLKHHRKVAIKVLHPELAAYVGPNRFLREIEIAAGLQHPHILPLIDSGQAGDLPYYVTPFVTGETLRERLTREGRLLMGDALWLAWEVADALDYAHAHGVIHRDIKPENILLSRQHAVVADFGIAKAVGAAEERSETAAGVVLGSPGYMSPEQAAGRPVIEPQTDIFSLGVVLYEMLCGVLPFSGAAVSASIGRALPAPPPPRSHREDVPPWLEEVMLKALASDPSDRFATASELAAALHPATGARPTPTRTMSPVQPGRVARTAVTTPASGAPDTIAARSIAVLPFENMSPDPEDAYFSDGITEEIINVLTRVPGLQVAARTSSFAFRGTQMNIRTVCGRLNVRTALEGSVRRAGNRIRITAQLIDAANGYHLWAERYDRVLHDVFGIQDEIAAAIVDELKIKLRDIEVRPVARRATDNLEAFELYLRGRHSWNERGLAPVQRALALFRAAVARDPAYAPAYAGIADCYFVLTHWGYLAPREGYREAKRAAQRAIELDDSLAEGRVSLASVSFCYDWDWPLAEREFLRAIELEPRLANARYSYSVCLAACGRFDEAIAQGKEACRFDPLNRQVASVLGRAYYLARRYGEAVDAMRQSLTLTPDIASTHMWLALSLLELERDAEAVSEAAIGLDLAPSSPTCVAIKGYVAGRVGDRQSAEKAVTQLRGQTLSVAFCLGWVCLGLGNEEEALEWLRKSIDEREDGLVTYGLAPIFDSVRADPRFTALWERAGMAAVALTPVARPPDRQPPAVSDRYRIERELGRGGNGVVYLAHDLKYDRKVALKVLPPDLALAVRSERFLREIQIAAKLSHPHILPLYDSGEARLEREGTPILFYVMPHVEGESLRERLKRETQIALEDAVAITRDVASALDHAHAHGVVHRDIKPENILLSHGKPIVMDFGIARALTSAGGATLTDAGIAIGTPAYMSPEQSAASSALDARADVYSLGCMVYEMLAGHAPFGGANAQELLARHNLDPVPSLRAARPDCPPAVEQTLSKALAKVPAARFRSAGDFARALEQSVAESRRFGPKLLRWALAALVALAALALVLWLA